MSIYKCKMCKGNLQIRDEENGICECDSCGSIQTVPLKQNKRKGELYNLANQYRKDNRFDQALEVYRNMIHEFPDEAEAYWGAVLCRYGIEYVEDPKTGKMIPTCHRTISHPIFKDSDYILSCEKAKPRVRERYEKEAAEIDRLQEKILMVVEKEEPFDIFISYKEQDDTTGQRTEDSVLAYEIYDKLTREGYKVFFSRVTLEGRLGEDYEPIIYAALNSAKILLLVGTSKEHMNAVWVRNEWTRFLDMIEKDPESKLIIPIYEKMSPYDIPEEISRRRIQALDASKIGYHQDLLHGIKKVLKGSQKNVAPVFNSTGFDSANTGAMIERGFICLKDGMFEEASEIFNQVLNLDPHSAGAYLGRIMVSRNVKNIEELKNESEPLSSNNDYKHVMEYGDAKLKKQLRMYNDSIFGFNKEYALDLLQNTIDEFSQLIEEKKQGISGWQAEIKEAQEKIASKQPTLDLSKRISNIQSSLMTVEIIVGLIILAILMINRWSYYWSSGNGFFGKIAAIINCVLMGAVLVIIVGLVYVIVSAILNAIVNKKMGGPKDQVLEEIGKVITFSNELIDDRSEKIEKYNQELIVITKVHARISEGKEELAEQLAQLDGKLIEDTVDQFVNDMLMEGK